VARYKNFDAFFAEAKQEPIVLRYQGETHHLPSSLPVATLLHLQRLQAGGPEQKVSDQQLIKLFASVFGQDRYQKWVHGGMTLEQMMELLRWALTQYGMAASADGEGPNAEAPQVE